MKECADFSKICDLKTCSLCSISKNGFKLNFAGKGIANDLRYGKGIYFSNEIEKCL